MKIGERLRALHKAAGYRHLAEFARAAGVYPVTAQQQVNRGSIPLASAQKYVAAATGTGVTLDWLLAGKGAPPIQLSRRPTVTQSPIARMRALVESGALDRWHVSGANASEISTALRLIPEVLEQLDTALAELRKVA